jgi:DNA (cytosine-5)-methyltransferase 1
MKFGSVCSGIEAASVAWNQIGWEAAWFSEIEPFPSALLNHYYPDIQNLGDMTTLPDRIESGEVEAPDVFCGGTPCQAFSLAGQRKSLADARGNLSLTFCEIADAIDSVRSVRGERPCIVFWENVPGVLSTADNAFGCFLAQLCGGDEPLVAPDGWPDAGVVSGPKRTVSWRVLDAQYFGVAQRRRRVFVVASARNDFDPATVLFEFDGLRRDSAPSREAGEITPTLTKEGTGVSRPGHNEDGWYVAQPDVAMCLNAGAMRRQDGESETFMAAPVAPCIDASFGRLQGCSGQDANHGHSHLIAFHPTQDPIHSTEVCHSIGANENATAAVMQPTVLVGGVDNENNGHTAEEPTGPLLKGSPTGGGRPLPAIAVMQAVGTDCYNGAITGDIAATMGTPGSSINASGPTVMQAMQVRRLTPTECERLQGFPDGYTAIPWRGKTAEECPDGPRYKALGNSWAVPVVTWIGKRIQKNLA